MLQHIFIGIQMKKNIFSDHKHKGRGQVSPLAPKNKNNKRLFLTAIDKTTSVMVLKAVLGYKLKLSHLENCLSR